MRLATINGHKLEIFDSIDELNIVRFSKYNKFNLIDAGIGDDLRSLNAHVDKIAKLMNKDQESAIKELQNYQQNLFFINQEMSPKRLAFTALVKSIDGKEVHDISDENLKKVHEKLNREKHTIFDKLMELVKKKLNDELELFFPGKFESAEIKEYFDKLKERTNLQLDQITNKTDNSKKIKAIDDYLLMFTKPSSFVGKDSAEISFEKNFEDLCLFIKKQLNQDAKTMTVLSFYNALEYIKKTNKPVKRHGRKSNKNQ